MFNEGISESNMYCKRGKICWAKLLHFSRFSRAPQKFFHEYNCLFLIILNNEYLWPRQCKNISLKTSMALKPRIFNPANLSPSTVSCFLVTLNHSPHCCSQSASWWWIKEDTRSFKHSLEVTQDQARQMETLWIKESHPHGLLSDNIA